jgi:uncharacterized membrane protein YphA (DoxX/SURF4 family)
MKTRVEAKQRDLIGEKGITLDSKPPAWMDTAKQVETMLVSELANLADESQQKKGSLPSEKNSLQKQDTFVTYSLLAIGICLMIGLLTPFASLGGAAFLLSIVAAQPFWISGTVPTYNQYVEIFALLFLAVSCAGKYAGLDYVLSGLFAGRCCSTKGKST